MWDGVQSTPLVTPENEPSGFVSRRLLIPNDIDFLQLVNGVLSALIDPESYTETPGGLTVDRTVELFNAMFSEYLRGEIDMIGSIVMLARSSLPSGMLWCDGATYNRVDYPELYAVLPLNLLLSADTFKTPDMRERFPIGASTNLSYLLAGAGGEATVTLTTAKIPAHTHVQNSHLHTSPAHGHTSPVHGHTSPVHSHTIADHSHSIAAKDNTGSGTSNLARGSGAGTSNPAATGTAALVPSSVAVSIDTTAAVINTTAATIDAATATNQNAGGGEAHNNTPPYLSLNFAIITR